MNQYKLRNEIIKAIGYRSYKHYLRSPLWKRIRSEVLIEQPMCVAECGRASKQVHHSWYSMSNLSGKTLKGLVGICALCHHQIEFKSNGHKVECASVQKRLDGLIKHHRMLRLESLR